MARAMDVDWRTTARVEVAKNLKRQVEKAPAMDTLRHLPRLVIVCVWRSFFQTLCSSLPFCIPSTMSGCMFRFPHLFNLMSYPRSTVRFLHKSRPAFPSNSPRSFVTRSKAMRHWGQVFPVGGRYCPSTCYCVTCFTSVGRSGTSDLEEDDENHKVNSVPSSEKSLTLPNVDIASLTA